MTFLSLYSIAFPIVFCIAGLKKKWEKIPFLMLILLAVIRYDTVTDYYSYIDIFARIRQGEIEWFVYEPLFHILNIIFSFTSRGYIFVIMICTLLPYLALYIYAKKYNVLYWSALLFYLLGYITQFDNAVRQDVAIGLFVFSIPYAIKKEKMKFSMLNLVGVGFHYTAFICFIFYPLLQYTRKVKISFPKYMVIIILLFFLVVSGLCFHFFSFVMAHIPFFSDYVIFLDFFKSHDGLGLGALFRFLILLLPVFLYQNDQREEIKFCVNMSFFCIVVEILCSDFSFLVRTANYLFAFKIISLALVLKEKKWRFSLAYILIIVLFFFYVNTRYIISYYGTENVFYTILSDNAKGYLIYERQVNRNLEWDEDMVKDRSKLIRYEP